MLYTGERNYGCRFLEVSLFGYRTIILENEKIRLMILVDKGTDIIEFNHKATDTNFIWRTPIGLSSLRKAQSFHQNYLLDTYTGGWFEAFPNVGSDTTYKGAHLPGYAEVCYLPWEYAVEVDSPEQVSLRCYVRGTLMPYRLEKTFTVKSGVSALFIEEKVLNEGREPMPFQWGHHPNFGAPFLDGSCRIDLPECDVRVMCGGGPADRTARDANGKWYLLPAKNGGWVDLREVPAPGSGTSELFWLTNLQGNWAAVRNPGKGVGIGLAWDPTMFTHSLIWLVANGDSGYPRYGDTYVLCFLPKNTNIHNLDKAVEAGEAGWIQPGETRHTWITASAFQDDGKENLPVMGILRDGLVLRQG